MREDSARKWRRLIAKQQASRLTIAEFCRRQKISDVSFYLWRKKLAQMPVSDSEFVPLTVATDAAVEVDFAWCAKMRIPSGDHRSLQSVISVLLGVSETR